MYHVINDGVWNAVQEVNQFDNVAFVTRDSRVYATTHPGICLLEVIGSADDPHGIGNYVINELAKILARLSLDIVCSGFDALEFEKIQAIVSIFSAHHKGWQSVLASYA